MAESYDRALDCFATPESGVDALPVHAVRPEGLDAFLAGAGAAHASFLGASGFKAQSGQLVLLPGGAGLAGAVLGLGDERSHFAFGPLPRRLPPALVWRMADGDFTIADPVLGIALGAYQQRGGKQEQFARFVLPDDPAVEPALAAARATWMVRDLVNAPANLLGPAELAAAVVALAEKFGAESALVEGAALEAGYPAVAAVGRGSDRPPVVAKLRWAGSAAAADAPLIALCGKGVCFDSGGYDLKPASGMLRMKKDMGGAALMMGLAHMIMAADLPVRLHLFVGCVENSVSGRAMRPLDVLQTRKGLTVEVGNTDAEGRLVLCDLLTEACEESPALLLNAATLTGAARVALGPDLPALFTRHDSLAHEIVTAGEAVSDPLWRLPLWEGYSPWLRGRAADLNNVSNNSFAGAIIAALFLGKFVGSEIIWGHVDTYAWNDSDRPARPEGGEALGLRALFVAVRSIIVSRVSDRSQTHEIV